jgi:5-methylcytosine-specific restriction enzyme subunit McrC
MLEYAYRLESFQFLKGLIDCKSLADFYERLANILAHRVLDRGRKGFYRTYVPESDALPFLRGRISLSSVLQRPWDVRFHCHYEEHTGDVVENQILSWTLSRIAQSGMCTDRVLPTVRRGYHSIRGFASLQPFRPHDCVGRLYNRLNEDYQPLHALCRFFLEHTGPSHEIGDRRMLPFLVHMERLFELFVAKWLKVHLPPELSLRVQEKVEVAETHELFFKIDLVLYSVETGKVLCVLDTKYKTKERPDSDDIAQVIAYAEMKGCQQAVLVYPQMIPSSLDINVGRIRVRTATFALSSDLEEAGRAFRQDILKGLGTIAQERGGWE